MVQVFEGSGRSMHVKDTSVGAICSTAIVGSGLPLACGVAFASKFKKEDRITCVFFGDGAINEGVFYESINLASIWHLPVLFILENNRVAVTTLLESTNLIHRADAFEINQQVIDGQYVDDVYNATERAIEAIKRNGRPALIEIKTYRFHEHQEGLAYEKMKDTNYRDNELVQSWQDNKDPIQLYISKLVIDNIVSPSEIRAIYLEENELIKQKLFINIGRIFFFAFRYKLSEYINGS